MSKHVEIVSIEDIIQIIQPLSDAVKTLTLKLNQKEKDKKYYRNKDLKDKFGLSDNTIIKYRNENKLPYTFIGDADIYYYPVDEIEKILERNSNYTNVIDLK